MKIMKLPNTTQTKPLPLRYAHRYYGRTACMLVHYCNVIDSDCRRNDSRKKRQPRSPMWARSIVSGAAEIEGTVVHLPSFLVLDLGQSSVNTLYGLFRNYVE